MAIAHLDEHAKSIDSPEEHQFIAPAGGIFRFYGGYNSYDISVTVNDVLMSPFGSFNYVNLTDSFVIKLLKMML